MDKLTQLINQSNQQIQRTINQNQQLQQDNTALHRELMHINNRKTIPGLTPTESQEILHDYGCSKKSNLSRLIFYDFCIKNMYY